MLFFVQFFVWFDGMLELCFEKKDGVLWHLALGVVDLAFTRKFEGLIIAQVFAD